MNRILPLKDIMLVEVKSEIAAGTRGASLGIDAVKIASLDLESDYFTRFDSEEVENVNDILFDGYAHPHAKFIDGVLTMEKRVCSKVGEVLKVNNFPIVLAGDHSTAAGTICGIKQTFADKRLGVIWIDAHADMHTPYTTPSGNMHGMPLAMVSNLDNKDCQINNPKGETVEMWEELKRIGGEGAKISLSDVVFISVRDFEEPEKFLMQQHNITNFSTQQVRSEGVAAIAAKALELLKDCDLIYISFDVDSMDSKFSVGTGTPVPNGLTVEEAKELNTILIKDPKVIAWEMVEVNPTLDTENKMAENAFEILEATTNALLEK
ncbi:Arginase [Fulvivirga imtechensis AK7]|uniref:Arginase n=1 Tax=Fulvivirga imtechensis AK7 TaxID=1237149 RepID=L8JMB5_9BACT|nr:arginase [Fulvivirga imtechensis]ELR68532.1 Arginase [Fulvivirga imtechensis AK7]